ncbi:unnamed protein product [Pleuronectes platessa]|uniref:Uncharacterized protein n=1 Tax=Pleuronectes platessa TaxID=8262 RepID=A0A9N7ZES9_PLEPL|nr:unnamed protein product [Pleuronectes platessa]
MDCPPSPSPSLESRAWERRVIHVEEAEEAQWFVSCRAHYSLELVSLRLVEQTGRKPDTGTPSSSSWKFLHVPEWSGRQLSASVSAAIKMIVISSRLAVSEDVSDLVCGSIKAAAAAKVKKRESDTKAGKSHVPASTLSSGGSGPSV